VSEEWHEGICSLGPPLWHDLGTSQLCGIFSLMHVNWCTFCYAGGKTAVIMLKIVGTTLHNFVSGATRHPGLVFLWSIGSTVTMALCIHYLWMEEAASRYWEWWLQMYWMTGCRQLTGLSIILDLDATNLFNILTGPQTWTFSLGRLAILFYGGVYIHGWVYKQVKVTALFSVCSV